MCARCADYSIAEQQLDAAEAAAEGVAPPPDAGGGTFDESHENHDVLDAELLAAAEKGEAAAGISSDGTPASRPSVASPTAATASPSVATGCTSAAAALDFSAALPRNAHEISNELKRKRDARHERKQRTRAVRVLRDEISGENGSRKVTWRILARVARHLQVSVKRSSENGRTVDSVRADVVRAWPMGQAVLELGSEM